MSNKKIYNFGAFGIPHQIRTDFNKLRLDLEWSRHSVDELSQDRYGQLPAGTLPFRGPFCGTDWVLVEVETFVCVGRGEIPTKYVVRRDVDAGRSLVLVIIPDGPGWGFVKTAWINLTTDTHRTLDKNRFDRP